MGGLLLSGRSRRAAVARRRVLACALASAAPAIRRSVSNTARSVSAVMRACVRYRLAFYGLHGLAVESGFSTRFERLSLRRRSRPCLPTMRRGAGTGELSKSCRIADRSQHIRSRHVPCEPLSEGHEGWAPISGGGCVSTPLSERHLDPWSNRETPEGRGHASQATEPARDCQGYVQVAGVVVQLGSPS